VELVEVVDVSVADVSVADVAEVSVVVAGSEDVEGGAMPAMRSMIGPLSGFTVIAL